MSTTAALRIAPINAEQARAWDGETGAYWAEHQDHFDRAVSVHHRVLLAAAALAATDRVLDIGCGTGQTTCDAARTAPSGTALGVDLSARMLACARRRATAEGISNVAFQQVDAQVHPFTVGSFDVAISRTGAMFFGDPVAAFSNIARALTPGGRLVLTVWQPVAANEWIREISGALAAGRELPSPPADAPGPFSLSDPDRARAILTTSGFSDVECDGTVAPMWFGSDTADAHRFVLGMMGWMLDGLDDHQRAGAEDALRETMATHETAEGVLFESATWTISASRA